MTFDEDFWGYDPPSREPKVLVHEPSDLVLASNMRRSRCWIPYGGYPGDFSADRRHRTLTGSRYCLDCGWIL